MGALLIDVLTEEEKLQIQQLMPNKDIRRASIKNLNVTELSTIAFILIDTEYNGKIPEQPSVSSAIAIEILINRAYKKNLKVF